MRVLKLNTTIVAALKSAAKTHECERHAAVGEGKSEDAVIAEAQTVADFAERIEKILEHNGMTEMFVGRVV